ncbi:protoporphyrinogen oxidase [Streptomyces sp. NPDC032198]|uniref:protoporphyrinogen oxidase n=1 Tax=Streptomyces sp. NPDC032198 TaxID=3155127 RepID=UPI0033C91105
MRSVIVIGAGISGLTAAWALRDTARVTVLDSAPRVGGKIRTGRVAGVPVDLGAESMVTMGPDAVRLAEAVGLGDALCEPAAAPITIWTHDALRPMPPGHLMGIPSRPELMARSGLLSDEGLNRLHLGEDLEPLPPTTDVTVGGYLEPLIGREAVDRLVAPVLGGIYGGDAYRLSLASALPFLTGITESGEPLMTALRRRESARAGAPRTSPVRGVRGGMGRLAQAVAESSGATVLTGTTARAVCQEAETRAQADAKANGAWRVHADTDDGPLALDADAVILAVPSDVAARLLGPHAPHAAKALAEVEHASSAVVTLAFPADGATREAFAGRNGFLVPPVDGRAVKGATFLSAKWPWYAQDAPGVFIVRASLGRAGADSPLGVPDRTLADAALSDLTAALGPLDEPVASRVTRWERGLPQYHVGHGARMDLVRDELASLPGLDVCGATYRGVGVASCISSGLAVARRMAPETEPFTRQEPADEQ